MCVLARLRNPWEGSEYHEGDKGSLDQVLLSSLRVDNHDSEVLLIELPFLRAHKISKLSIFPSYGIGC